MKYKMPTKSDLKGRSSTISNAFAISVTPFIRPTEEELATYYSLLGIKEGQCAYCLGDGNGRDHLKPLVNAVWFPSVSDTRLRTMTLPSEADKALIMTKEALEDPQKYIDRIFGTELPNGIKTDLSEYDEKKIIREIFCPQFNIDNNQI